MNNHSISTAILREVTSIYHRHGHGLDLRVGISKQGVRVVLTDIRDGKVRSHSGFRTEYSDPSPVDNTNKRMFDCLRRLGLDVVSLNEVANV